MDALPAELVDAIIRLVNWESKKGLSSIDSSWRTVAEEYYYGEFDLYINVHVNSLIPSVDHNIYIKHLASQNSRPWNDEFVKDVDLIHDVHLSIQNNFTLNKRAEAEVAKQHFEFIEKVFALARHGRRMHLTVDVQSNGQNPPQQCELLRELLDLIPRVPVATVDHHNCASNNCGFMVCFIAMCIFIPIVWAYL
uniref:F-box domain-containing protein n=1 Tax=Steinernema glaseri TaxID=37863 RepID=A0A1I8ASX8_9BILA